MYGSSTLLAGGLASSPARRAAAVLRLALQRSAAASPKKSQRSAAVTPPYFNAMSELFEGPVRITYPRSLAARLGALSLDEEAFTGQRALPADDTLVAQDHAFLQDFAPAETEKENNPIEVGDVETGADGVALADEAGPRLSSSDMRALVRDFQRRQRHASLLFAGGLASAFLFTLGGLLLLASFLPQAAAVPKGDEPVPHRSTPAPKRATSIAWHQQAHAEGFTGLQFAYARSGSAAKAVAAPARRKETWPGVECF